MKFRAPAPRYAVPAAIVAVISIIVVVLKFLLIDQMHGDSALFFQATDNVAAHGALTSSVYAYVWAYLQSHLIRLPADALAANPLLAPSHPNENVLRLHTYFVLYPLGLLAKIVPTRIVLLSAYVLSFTGTLFLSYALLVRRGVGIAAASLFALIVMVHPAWGDGLLLGQFYPDRLFVLFGFVLLLVAASSQRRRFLLIAVAIACASVNERGGIIAGIVLMLYSVLYRKTATDAAFKFCLGAATFAFGELMLKFVVVNPAYANFIRPDRLLHQWGRPLYVEMIAVFVLVNVALLVVASFEWRAAVIAFITMIPNILGSVGGMEKVAWITHYHSYYLPVLIWAAALGFVRAYELTRKQNVPKLFYAGGVCVVLYLASINPYALPVAFSPTQFAQTFPPKLYDEANAFLGPQGVEIHAWGAELAAAIPKGATVSTPESGMPSLYPGRTLYILPMGIDQADYAVLTFQKDVAGRTTYGGVLDVRGAAEEQAANVVIMRRMRRDGYDLDHPVLEIPGWSFAVVKRLQTHRYARSSESAASRPASPMRARRNVRPQSHDTLPAT